MLADALELSGPDRTSLFSLARPELGESAEKASRSVGPDHGTRPTMLPLRLQPLPLPMTALVGRRQEVDQLTSLLLDEQTRLVTVVGPGGVGKTHLCIATGSRLAGAFEDGVALVDLSALNQPELLSVSIIEALGLATDAAGSALDSLRESLRNRTLLLILDNFEQLIDAAPVLTSLLTSSPGLKILVTSRIRLHLRGEHVLLLEPLAVPPSGHDGAHHGETGLADYPAVALFLTRAAEVDPRLVFGASNLAAVAEICRRLDGLPLAIELAASRISAHSPESLLERLVRRLPALTGGPRDAPERQRTLAGTIAWSYDLLEPQAQRTFCRLAVFSGGFTLDAAQTVTSDPGEDVVGTIESLVDHSLLRRLPIPHGVDRFTMLETVREFAETAFLSSDEVDDIRRRHSDWFIHLVERAEHDVATNVNVRYWYGVMDAELPNVRIALDYLLDSGDAEGAVRILVPGMFYWADRPNYPDLRRWLQALVELAPVEVSAAAAHVQGTLAYTAAWLGEYETANLHLARTKEIAEALNDRMTTCRWLNYEAVVAEFGGNAAKAAGFYEAALAYAVELGRFHDIQGCMAEMAAKWVLLGDVKRAIPKLDEALAMAREEGASTLVSHTLIHRAYAALAMGEIAAAAAFLTESLELAQTFGLYRDVLGAIAGLAGVALTNGDPESSARLFGAIESAGQSTGVYRIFDLSHAERVEDATRAALGTDAFDKLRQQGATMTYMQAIASARDIASTAQNAPVTEL
jgi:predicted ATPase